MTGSGRELRAFRAGLALVKKRNRSVFPDVPVFRKFGDFGRVTERGVRESVCVEMSVGERSSLGEGVDDGGSRK